MLTEEGCPSNVLAIRDVLDALEGRWKLQIMFSLATGSKRFGQLSKELQGITDKMLSKELKLLEANKSIKREVYDASPPVIAYSITDHGKSLQDLLDELHRWGLKHRKEVLGK